MAYADGRDYNDGPVQTVTFIRTLDGHFDDYMHWLATTYKKQQEAAKAAGLITLEIGTRVQCDCGRRRGQSGWEARAERSMAMAAYAMTTVTAQRISVR
jgi:hypothetical protein